MPDIHLTDEQIHFLRDWGIDQWADPDYVDDCEWEPEQIAMATSIRRAFGLEF